MQKTDYNKNNYNTINYGSHSKNNLFCHYEIRSRKLCQIIERTANVMGAKKFITVRHFAKEYICKTLILMWHAIDEANRTDLSNFQEAAQRAFLREINIERQLL